LKARTGELTPPGMLCCARAKSSRLLLWSNMCQNGCWTKLKHKSSKPVPERIQVLDHGTCLWQNRLIGSQADDKTAGAAATEPVRPHTKAKRPRHPLCPTAGVRHRCKKINAHLHNSKKPPILPSQYRTSYPYTSYMQQGLRGELLYGRRFRIYTFCGQF
jgi:hypothetical protein